MVTLPLIDRNCYQGFEKVNSTGLVNNPGIARISASTGVGGGTRWSQKTADEILNDINSAISALWRDNDCSIDALPNHILVPVEQFGALVTRKVSDDSERSILSYVLENNLTTQQGGELIISPCKWCSRVGSSRSDRMVVYCNRIDRICFNLTQPLRRMETEYAEMRIKIPYIAQFSEVRFLYPSTAFTGVADIALDTDADDSEYVTLNVCGTMYVASCGTFFISCISSIPVA